MSHYRYIALLTDFGVKDPYVAIMKGVIYTINPDVKIIDVSHDISPQNILQSAFVINGAYSYFPSGTIFTIVVDPGVGSGRGIIALVMDKYIFVAPDNGVLSYIIKNNKNYTIYKVENEKYFLKDVSNTFHGRDIFAPVSANISKGIPINTLGNVKDVSECKLIDIPLPIIKDNTIYGDIIYIDHFGNAISNISKGMLNNKKIKLIRIGSIVVDRLYNSYAQADDLLAIINSYGLLEISKKNGSAANMGIALFDKVIVEYI